MHGLQGREMQGRVRDSQLGVLKNTYVWHGVLQRAAFEHRRDAMFLRDERRTDQGGKVDQLGSIDREVSQLDQRSRARLHVRAGSPARSIDPAGPAEPDPCAHRGHN